MHTLEITIHRLHEGSWPVVVRHQPGKSALTLWANGIFDLDLEQLNFYYLADKEYGTLLGKNLFRNELRDAFVRAISGAKAAGKPLRVYLIVEADDLRPLHWEQLCAPFEGGRWDYLLLNQQSPFSLYLPSQIERRFPPIGRRDLRALLLVAGPEELEGDYKLAPFDVHETIVGTRAALGDVPCDILASEEGAIGIPTLDALCEQLTAKSYTLLHIVCHGVYKKENGETLLFYPIDDQRKRLVSGSEMITRLSRLESVHGLPHFTFLSTCESAKPQAENGFGGLAQRLVRDLGMPAVLAMTDRVSIPTAQALATAFYNRLNEHGEVDRALVEALAGLQGRFDVTVPALLSRLGGRPLFSDALDRPLSEAEINFGLEQQHKLLKQRAPILLQEFDAHATTVQATLGTQAAALSQEARRERENAMAAINQLSSQALDLSFNALALGKKPPDYDDRCPFRGLYPFRVEDREFFFGRQALVEKLRKRLNEHNFLAVLGPSGCGKSSLVLAGLVPALGNQIVYLTPGSEPLAQLEAALIQTRAEDEDRHLVVVDQFEELFTLCRDEDQRRVFIERMLELAMHHYFVLTMRADFWGECAAFPALKEEMQSHQELVAPLEASDLRRAMEWQADHVGLRFDAGLGEGILEDVQGEPGAMPLLQHALLLLWERRHGRWLRREEYQAIGGIQQAISHTAEMVYSQLSDFNKERMREIFVRLTRLEEEGTQEVARDTRRRVEIAELVPVGSDPADTVALVNRLADARLVVTSLNAASNQEEVEVAHEALIRHWPRLRDWIDESRAWLQLHTGIRQAALEWQAQGQEAAYLLHRGGRLEDATALSKEAKIALNDLEQAYLEACIELRERDRREKEEQQRRELQAAQKLAEEQRARADEQAATTARMRRRALIITGVGAVAIVLAILAGIFYFRSQANAEEAEKQANLAHARELAALALNQVDQKLDLALLLSIEAYGMKDFLQTRQALFSTWGHNPQLLRFLLGHSAWVDSVAWSPDGRLASGSGDNTVIVWDLESGEPDMTLEGHSDWVSSVAWSPDGRLASGSEDNTVILWDLESGLPEMTLEGHSSTVISVAWSPDGRLASGSYDKTVIVWDVESGEPDVTLEGHSDWIGSVAWSPGGQLASGSEDNTVVVWDLESGLPNVTLHGHSDGVRSVAWSLDGRLASGSWDNTVIVWDLESGEPEVTLEGHSDWVGSVAWSPDGRLASSSYDKTVIVWDLESWGPEVTLQGHSDLVWSVAWSPDGSLASGSRDETVIVWNLESERPAVTLEGHSWWVDSVDWSPDGRLASGSWDKTVILWDLESGEPDVTLEREHDVTLEEHSDWVSSVAWSPEGRLASGSGSGDNTVIVWDLESGIPEMTLEGHSLSVNSVAWSPNGRLASGSLDATVILWDLESGLPEMTLEGHSDGVNSVAWSPGGRLASGSDDKTVIIWDLESREPERTLEGHWSSVFSVAWSPDGRLASGAWPKTVIVWDLESGEPEMILEGHSDWVSSVAWSLEGRLASGSGDKTIIVWDLESGLPEMTLEGHSDAVESVAWSPDGRLASGSRDETVIVWQMDPEVWFSQACQRAKRNLTQDEWAQYFPDEEYRKTCDQWPLETN